MMIMSTIVLFKELIFQYIYIIWTNKLTFF